MTQMQKARQQTRQQQRLRRRRFFFILMTIGLIALIIGLLIYRGKPGPKEITTSHPYATNSSIPNTTHKTAESSDLPEGWLRKQTTKAELAQGTLILVNRDHAYNPDLPETVSVYSCKTRNYLVKDTLLRVRTDAMAALNLWMDAFAAESGKTDVNIVSGWRSYEDQSELYHNAVETKGQAHADAFLALPGCSEHHTGLAVDLDTYDTERGTSGGFDGDGVYAWAVEHAWEYGFIQRYPPQKSAVTGIDYESWHFRYVGLPHAYVMAAENLCLEEYIDHLRSFPFFGTHLYVDCLGTSYELYFCPEGELVVPESGDYTVCGNNVDGFIVTIANK